MIAVRPESLSSWTDQPFAPCVPLVSVGAVTATVLFGLTATTSAGSVAAAAVLAAFTAAVFVPSFTLVVWLPRVVWFAEVAAPEGRGRDAAETAMVPVPAFAVTVPEPGTVPVMGAGASDTGTVLVGEIATTTALSAATAAVDAALTEATLVPSVILVCWEPPE